MQLFQCRPQDIDAAWKDGASALAEATKWASREVTPDQLKMLLARGERILIGARDEDGKVLGWAAVQVSQYPNIRVLHVYAMQGKGIVSREGFALLREYAAHHGCASIRGCVRPSMERLLLKLGAQPVYTTVELEVA